MVDKTTGTGCVNAEHLKTSLLVQISLVNILLISQNEHNIIRFMQIIFCVMFYIFFFFFFFVFCIVKCLFVQLYNQSISSYFHLVQVVVDIEDRMVIFTISWCCISVLFVICNRSS